MLNTSTRYMRLKRSIAHDNKERTKQSNMMITILAAATLLQSFKATR